MTGSHSCDDNADNALRIAGLRAENTVNLLGTEVEHPRLSWRIEAPERDVRQLAYRIRAAENRDALIGSASLLWDSGLVESGETFDIPYGGQPLQSMQTLWWDVEVQDNLGRTAKSSPAWLESGLMHSDDWHGKWIQAEDELSAADRRAGLAWIWSKQPLDGRLHGFRREFEVPEESERAKIMVSGKDNLHGVWVNGRAVKLPARRYWGTMLSVDATLQPGRNTLCIAVTANTSGRFQVDGGALAVLVHLRGKHGVTKRIVSDTLWRVIPDPPVGWQNPDFDASAWLQARPSLSGAQGDPRPPEPAMLVRREFSVKSKPVRARLYATALGAYHARLNGKDVSDRVLAPEISVASHHVFYQVHDVTALVNSGKNALGFMVADGFYASAYGRGMERYSFGPAPRRLLAQLRLDYQDGETLWVTTDSEWRIAESAVVRSDIYGGENYDARLEQEGWDRPGFDDSHWRKVSIDPGPDIALVAQTSPPLRPKAVLRATKISEPETGKFVLDFGQNFSGVVRMRVNGNSGQPIILRHAEILTQDGTVDQSNLRNAQATDCFIPWGERGDAFFQPRFTYHGFRYVQVEGFPGVPSVENFEAIMIRSDCDETGEIEFNNPLLHQIWRNTLWSQRSNFFSIPTDCPQRDERMGWMGDIQVFFDAAAFNMDIDAFTRRYLAETRAQQREDGGYPIVVPAPLSYPDYVTAGWSEAGVILPHGLWFRYGDTHVIEENWVAMERWMNLVSRHNPDHLWCNERGLDLGDWLSVDAREPDDETTPHELCATAYWALSARLMSDMASATGREQAAAKYHALFRSIKKAFCACLVSSEGVAGNGSQTSQVLALYTQLMPDNLRKAAVRHLADDIRQRGMKLSTGFLGTPYLLDVLADGGEWEVVQSLLLQTEYPSWGYMPVHGATTVWERWNSDIGDIAMNSYNHYALGAVVGFFYRRLCGIAPAAPGFRRISVRPIWLPAVGKVSGFYNSCNGPITTEIDGDSNGILSLKVRVPGNCTAEIDLPGGFNWFESNSPLSECLDVDCHYGSANSVVRAAIGSGTYHFERS